MAGRNFYLLTALPAMGEIESDPPMSPGEFLQRVGDDLKVRAEAEAIFLAEDLRQREALLAGEIDEPAPTVLTPAQVRDEAPLPGELAAPAGPAEDATAAQLAVDRVWGAYFRHLAALGRRSEFLAAWVAHEVGLRNALAAARAKALGLDAQRYLVEPQFGEPEDEFTAVLGEWSAAATPLAALRALDAARWAWLVAHDGWFTFADDELAAYAAKLMLLHRWKRIAEVERETPAEAADG